MSPVLNKLAASTSVILLAGLALTGATSNAEAAAEAGGCQGMTAVNNRAVGNQAPVLANDTANLVAGDSHAIRVLANDSDPNGNRLFVVSLSTPLRGEACVEANGDIEYVSEISTTNYVQRLTYGVTDGDFYRTATLTVTVQGVKPVTAQVTQRLKKHGKKPGQRAHITFTNPNKRAMIIAAGSPKKRKPAIFRTLAPGQSAVLVTKQRRIIFVSARRDADGIPLLVGFGTVRTKTGKVVVHAVADEDDDYRTASPTGNQARGWIN